MKTFYQHLFGSYTIFQTPTLWDTYRHYNYILAKNNRAVIFDPGDYEPIDKTLKENNLTPEGIYLTHHHADHTLACETFQKEWNCPVYGFEGDQKRLPPLTHTFSDQEDLSILDLKAKVLFLPAHTMGLCCFHFPENHWLFSNDLVMSLGCGRVFEGTFQQMHESLQEVCKLPDETQLFCSHEYTKSNLDFALSILPNDSRLLKLKPSMIESEKKQIPSVPMSLAFEKENNPFLRCHEEGIRQALGFDHSSEDWQVFEKMRKLKDQF